MNIKKFIKENKKRYFISVSLVFIGGLLIMAIQNTFSLKGFLQLIPISFLGVAFFGFIFGILMD